MLSRDLFCTQADLDQLLEACRHLTKLIMSVSHSIEPEAYEGKERVTYIVYSGDIKK